MRLRNSFAAVLLALPLTLACGSDCYDLCDDAYEEGCSDFDHGACVKGCVDQEDFSDETDECDDVFEKFIDCVSDEDNICDTLYDPDHPTDEPKCNDEAIDYAECAADYCADHASKDWCEAP